MMTPLAKRLLGSTCALLLTASLSAPADGAFFNWFGHGCGYGGYSTYYGGSYGYGASCGGCGSCSQCCGYGGYTTAYRGYALYAPSYSLYAPSYCGTSCSSCVSSCNTACNPCGVSYSSCGNCGIASCSGCGIACASDCTNDCSTGSQPAVGTTEPENDPSQPKNDSYIGGDTPSTYTPNNNSSGGDSDPGGFRDPIPSGRSNSSGQGRSGSGSGEVLPEGSGGGGFDFDGAQFDQGVQKPPAEETIRQRNDDLPAGETSADDQQPADVEPTDDTDLGEPAEPKDTNIRPLNLRTELAKSAATDRRRALYSVRFHAPRVARLEVKPTSKWTPIDSGTKLAATE